MLLTTFLTTYAAFVVAQVTCHCLLYAWKRWYVLPRIPSIGAYVKEPTDEEIDAQLIASYEMTERVQRVQRRTEERVKQLVREGKIKQRYEPPLGGIGFC